MSESKKKESSENQGFE